MTEQQPNVDIPDEEEAVIAMLREDAKEELTEQQKNLAIAQAKLIGDL